MSILLETPPRAWGRRYGSELERTISRNTPTCVGKTKAPTTTEARFRNTPTCVGKTGSVYDMRKINQKHPHVRGEDETRHCAICEREETPPRAWGRLSVHAFRRAKQGNTPTCVGKTQLCKESKTFVQKHPHVRGEDHAFLFVIVLCFRNTPTCVGKTNDTLLTAVDGRKHPHVRGEDLT